MFHFDHSVFLPRTSQHFLEQGRQPCAQTIAWRTRSLCLYSLAKGWFSYTPVTWFPLNRLVRLSELRWRYTNPSAHRTVSQPMNLLLILEPESTLQCSRHIATALSHEPDPFYCCLRNGSFLFQVFLLKFSINLLLPYMLHVSHILFLLWFDFTSLLTFSFP
jgi:hypothetical protein